MSCQRRFSISTSSFYGGKVERENTQCVSKSEKCNIEHSVEKYPFKYLDVESPSTAWEVFRKQKDAIENAQRRKNGVMTFVCQTGTSGERRFIVAHPRVFWFYDCRKRTQRSSYEIIMEHACCKLYFDLEFSKETNPCHIGERMTDIFIKIVSFFLKKEWDIVCTRDHILELDSSTDTKFSRHLIYQLPGVIFKDNYHVGNFVKMLCNNLRLIKSTCNYSEIPSMGISNEDFTEIFVIDKGKEKLFCDESVYTKNRHFRLYLSSKWNKNAPLVCSAENKYLNNEPSSSENIFLSSLITYILDSKNHTTLQYNIGVNKSSNKYPYHLKTSITFHSEKQSPYPDIDQFIKKLVYPGKIYRWRFSESQKYIFYDIVGNRFCKNIGREHRSNNIRFVVDVKSKLFYQKCYDPDCKDFCSEPIQLPPELMFVLEGPIHCEDFIESNSLWQNHIPEEALSEVLDFIENCME